MISMTFPQYRRRECILNGRRIKLRHTENEMLSTLLVSPPDRFVHKSDLIEALWPNPDFEPDWAVNIVWRSICLLRAQGVPIETDCGFGWRIPLHARTGEQMRMAA